jgi:hypothetical protein
MEAGTLRTVRLINSIDQTACCEVLEHAGRVVAP